MFSFILLCCLAFFHTQEERTEWKPLVEYQTPLTSRVALTIAADRDTYYIHEPVILSTALQNQSDDEVRGYFFPDLATGRLEIYYRRQGGQFIKYRSARQERPPFFLILPRTLQSKETRQEAETLVLDMNAKRFVLEEPGIYEFKAVYNDLPGEQSSRLESNPIVIQVLPIAEHEHHALQLYDYEGIARLMQGDGGFDPAEVARQSALLFAKYPNSIYARHVLKRLATWLPKRVSAGGATENEKQLLKALNLQRENIK